MVVLLSVCFGGHFFCLKLKLHINSKVQIFENIQSSNHFPNQNFKYSNTSKAQIRSENSTYAQGQDSMQLKYYSESNTEYLQLYVLCHIHFHNC